jgi:hypothetical protein
MLCVERGLGSLGDDIGPSTLYFLLERSGMTREELADIPDEPILDLRSLFGLRSALIFSSIRKELILSSVGNHPRNGRLEEFLFALKKAKESVEAGIA